MKFKKTLLVGALSTAVAGLTGCGAENQDSTSDVQRTSFTGLVIDGRVAGGTIWVDKNENGLLDSVFEPQAETDPDGYFSRNPGDDGRWDTDDDINYCDDASDALKLKHCLVLETVSGISSTTNILRVQGGIDLDTGEPLEGVMSILLSQSDATTAALVSPLSSLYAATPDDQKADLLLGLGLDSAADLLLDYTSTAVDETPEDKLKKQRLHGIAFTVQQTSSIMTARLEKGLGDDSSEVATKQEVTLALAKAIVAKSFSDFSDVDFNEVFTQTKEQLTVALAETLSEEDSANAIASFEMNASVGETGTRAQRLSDLMEERLISLDTVVSTHDRRGALQAAAAVFVAAKAEAEDKDLGGSSIGHVLRLGNLIASDVFIQMVAALSSASAAQSKINIQQYSEQVAETSNTATDGVRRVDVGGFAGKALKFQDDDDPEFKGQVALYLNGDTETATTGVLSACVNFVDEVDPLDNLSNQYYGGTWQALTQDTIKVTMQHSGVKADAQVVVEGGNAFRFIFNGEDTIWENPDLTTDSNGLLVFDQAKMPIDTDDETDERSCKRVLEQTFGTT